MIDNFKGHKFVNVIPAEQSIYDTAGWTNYECQTAGWTNYECQVCKCMVKLYNNTFNDYYIFFNGIPGTTNTANPRTINFLKDEMSCNEYLIKGIIE